MGGHGLRLILAAPTNSSMAGGGPFVPWPRRSVSARRQ